MKILINSHPSQTRIAQIQGRKAVSLNFFNKHKSVQVGSIYKGRVIKTVPSLEACFVDLGGGLEAFLHQKEMGLLNGESNLSGAGPAQNKVQAGQMILVQIAKASSALKRARLTAVISFAGRSLVYLPQSSGIGVSRRIENPKERERLLGAVKELEPAGGVIIRTEAQGRKNFKQDLKNLYDLWESIKKKSRKSPGLIYSELEPELQVLRDELSARHSQVLIDDSAVYETAVQYVKKTMPQFSQKLVYYDEEEPLFEKFGVESQWNQALNRHVRLKSGGSIVIDENEAMVSIDVNTGRAGGKKSHQETVFKTNMEAVKEIASQLRLRNCGGIIVIDLIDMELSSLKEKVMNSFQEELKKDPIYTEVVSLSDLNLIQMTRKRTRQSLKSTLCEECPSCRGRGAVLSPHTLSCSIFRAAQDKALDISLGKKENNDEPFRLSAVCRPSTKEWIHKNEAKSLEFLRLKKNIILSVREDSSLNAEDFYIEEMKTS